MATHDWRESAPVRDNLINQSPQYNFYQAVRLLTPTHDRDVDSLEAIDDALKFTSESGDQFPTTDIFNINKIGHQMQITLSTFGLSGPLGPLPQQHGQLIESQAGSGKLALKKFLELFEHRLISLLYLTKQKYHAGLHKGQRENSDQYRYLVNVSGLPKVSNTENKHRHLPLLPFSGLLAGGRITTPSMINILSTLLDTEVSLSSAQGAFIKLDPAQHARLNKSDANSSSVAIKQRLGDKLALGRRVWNQSHGIKLEIGPVSYDKANDWTPGSDNYARFVELLLYITNGQWQLEIDINVNESTIPNSVLTQTTRLGFNSWLKTRDGDSGIKHTHRTIKPTHFH